ncbi:hypothetical protein ElyMa_004219300 [Elysia marginata]|uniref:MADF domain-containing protein n=1 Tax=Elysia marginata TaxID=1093978 RepID=A0AAV4GPN2_9GAST|nr:hypothetical protein ElyMa_004219300 [Elysia marginata]
MSRKQTENKFMLEVLKVYQTLPSLWKVKSEEYHNRQRKIEDYQVLLKKYKEYFPEATLEELKKKLNTLRTGFRTELRKINRSAKSGAGLDDLYESQAWFMSAMMFLVDQETPAQSRTSLPMPQMVQSDVGEEQVVLQVKRNLDLDPNSRM